MRSLKVKLTASFIVVSLVTILIVLILIRAGAKHSFDRYIEDSTNWSRPEAYETYFAENGSWDNLGSFIEADTALYNNTIIADNDGKILYAGLDTPVAGQVDEAILNNADPIIVDGQQVGWLIRIGSRGFGPAGPPEAQPSRATFENGLNRAILLSGIIAGSLALLLGYFLAQAIAKPVKLLTNATDRLVAGELGHQVQVHGQDEISQLAHSFNRMSHDLSHSEQLRRQMTADIAHDLRTPTSIILGYSEALADGKLAPDNDTFRVMHQEANHLAYLIEDLRTLSLADAGELQLQRSPLDPAWLLSRLARTYEPTAQEKSIELRVDIGSELPEIDGDESRLQQVLGNLMENALRHTPAGGQIALTANTVADQVEVSITDSGNGIPKADLVKIFDRFYRGDTARSPNGQTGLGLAIARSIVVAHGGDIRVENVDGSGARFSLQLPIYQSN